MVANSAKRRCWVTLPSEALPADVIDDRDVTELLGACAVNLDATEDTDGLLPCVGVTGADAAEEPNKRRVDENSRDGSLREEEYYKVIHYELRKTTIVSYLHSHSNQAHTFPSMEPNS